MEWIRISSHKLKIMLSAEDARRYELNCKVGDTADSATQKALRDILTDLRDKANFDAAENKIYVQMFPSKEGGCELFITKTGTPSQPAIGQTGKSFPVSPQRPRRAAFRFESSATLIALCRRLCAHYEGESEVWLDESGGWWLLLSAAPHSLSLGREFPYIAEYGKGWNETAARVRLPEHGRCISKSDAVERFGQL